MKLIARGPEPRTGFDLGEGWQGAKKKVVDFGFLSVFLSVLQANRILMAYHTPQYVRNR